MGRERSRDEPHVLLTNDDGIDAPGIRALADALADVASVTVVAPRRNQSAVGRSLSYGRTAGGASGEDLAVDLATGSFTAPVPHESHDLGYAIDGTPCDCVIVGVNAFERTPDLVVSGCNAGANLGAYVFGRSGTVSAAMEAAYLGVPAMAVSMDTLGYDRELVPGDFERAGDVAAGLASKTLAADPVDGLDYLNVNVPRPDRDPDGVAITRPTEVYEMDAALEGDAFHLSNELWRQMAAGEIPDPPGTDRRALLDGRVSVSPLSAPHDVVEHANVEKLVADALEAFGGVTSTFDD